MPPVTPESLIAATTVIELNSAHRDDVIRQLVSATHCHEYGVTDEELFVAIEEREATAQTIVADDLAIPHASVDWDGDFRVIVGRSRGGVEYGVSGTVVRLVILLVTGMNESSRHLKILSTLAEFLREPEFVESLIHAGNSQAPP